MGTDTVRLNVTLPKEIYKALSQNAGPRKKSQFIARAIKNQLEQQHKKVLIKALKEGYRKTRQESNVIADTFSFANAEKWDDY